MRISPASLVSLASLVAAAGCSSLVSDPCVDGYHLVNRQCVVTLSDDVDPTAPDAGVDPTAPDAGDSIVTPDAKGVSGPAEVDPWPRDPVAVAPDAAMPDAPPAPDAPSCSPDLLTDSDNCGRCDHVCASGLCGEGLCLGEPVGHVVAIGHDYATYHLGMTKVIANAIGIGASATVRVGWYRGSAGETTHTNVRFAASIGLASIGRATTSSTVASVADFANVDVVVVEPQTGDGDAAAAAGATWTSEVHAFLLHGGVVIVLEGPSGVSYRFADGAGLFTASAPVDATDGTAIVVAPNDAIAHTVPVPYRAEGGSVVWPNVSSAAIVVGGEAIAFHRWVQ